MLRRLGDPAAAPGLRAGVGAGALCLLAWGLFAALAPTALGIDHAGAAQHLQGRRPAPSKSALAHVLFGTYPLSALAPIAGGFGLLALGFACCARSARVRALRAGRAAIRCPRASTLEQLGVAVKRAAGADHEVAFARSVLRVREAGVEAVLCVPPLQSYR